MLWQIFLRTIEDYGGKMIPGGGYQKDKNFPSAKLLI